MAVRTVQREQKYIFARFPVAVIILPELEVVPSAYTFHENCNLTMRNGDTHVK